MKTIVIGVMPQEQIRARAIAIARGEYKPKPGEPLTKTVNDKKFHYCKKCNFWTPTHTTAEHVNKKKPPSDDAPEANCAGFGSPNIYQF